MDGLKPEMQRQLAFFKDRADANRKLATAIGALIEAVTFNAFRVLLGRLRAQLRERLGDTVTVPHLRNRP